MFQPVGSLKEQYLFWKVNMVSKYRAFIFSLTFLLYASFHLSRKPISIVKGELHKHCAASHEVELDSYKDYAAQIQPAKKPFNASQCGWAPFDKNNYKQLLGALDYSFLCAYAVGMYLSGLIGERLPIRYYLTGGMLASGLFTAMFGLGYFYNIHNLWFYIMAQSSKTFLNGASRCRIQMPALNAKENGKPQDPEVQHLLTDSENCSMALNSSTVVSGEGRHGTSAISFLGALRIPGVVEFSLCLLFAKLVSYTFLFWLPLYITNVEHLDAKRAGDLSTLFDVGGIFGGILAGLISDRLEKRASTCGMMLLLAAPTLYMFSTVSKMGLEATIKEEVGKPSSLDLVLQGFYRVKGEVMLLISGALVNGPYALITTAVSADLGTHKSLKGNARALSTVTAIIDGTGSVGKAELEITCLCWGAALGPLLAGLISPSGWNNVFYMLMVADACALLVIFSKYCNSKDIMDLFCIATGLPRNTTISLLTADNCMVSIDPTMPANTERSPYKVIPVATEQLSEKEELFQNLLGQIAEQFSRVFKINELQTEVANHLAMLEKKVELEGLKVVEIEKCKRDIKKMREEMAARSSRTNCPCKYSFLEENKRPALRRDVPSYPKYMLSQETIEALRKPTFDVWLWEPNEMLSCLEHMYHDLGLVKDFNINPITLKRWLLCIHDNYRNNPFHNFRHCFCVTQMMYSMISLCSLQEKFSQIDILILMTAAVCHDLDHPGYNNTYQINARTELAVRYNDISPLENHHCAVAFQIISQPEYNIFSNVDQDQFKQIRQGMITLILATDMARHAEILDSFKEKMENFDYSNEEHMTCLKMVLIKCCDISNEVRPMEVAEPWVDCLLEEYFMQSDREKSEGLPVAPFMDRDKVTKPTAQIGFLKFVLIPMFETVTKLFPEVEEVMLQPLWESRDHYEELKQIDDAMKEGKSESQGFPLLSNRDTSVKHLVGLDAKPNSYHYQKIETSGQTHLLDGLINEEAVTKRSDLVL
ncbi:hypothetical protein WISP_50574 [Willisornis vidua]|uniref:Phosphodiesterase n=1 Tax=Willisornis vidua TaxID=1566151 RepID=A0ABQ9DGQ9_9PASS|nr:hypothetical protein WISP_50574 [Willisornis vidua]